MFRSFVRRVKVFSPQRIAFVKAKLAQNITKQELVNLIEIKDITRETPSPVHSLPSNRILLVIPLRRFLQWISGNMESHPNQN